MGGNNPRYTKVCNAKCFSCAGHDGVLIASVNARRGVERGERKLIPSLDIDIFPSHVLEKHHYVINANVPR